MRRTAAAAAAVSAVSAAAAAAAATASAQGGTAHGPRRPLLTAWRTFSAWGWGPWRRWSLTMPRASHRAGPQPQAEQAHQALPRRRGHCTQKATRRKKNMQGATATAAPLHHAPPSAASHGDALGSRRAAQQAGDIDVGVARSGGRGRGRRRGRLCRRHWSPRERQRRACRGLRRGCVKSEGVTKWGTTGGRMARRAAALWRPRNCLSFLIKRTV